MMNTVSLTTQGCPLYAVQCLYLQAPLEFIRAQNTAALLQTSNTTLKELTCPKSPELVQNVCGSTCSEKQVIYLSACVLI